MSVPTLISRLGTYLYSRMKFKGPLGVPRFRNFGPLVDKRPLFSQEIQGADNFDEAINDIIEEKGFELEEQEDGQLVVKGNISNEDANEIAEKMDDESPSPIDVIKLELAGEVFPESERRQRRFVDCLDSNWSQNWARGFSDASDMEDLSEIERLSLKGTGCAGMVEANTLGP